MAAFDFDATIRWARFRSGKTMARRQEHELSYVGSAAANHPLMLDTCVYIDRLQGRAPAAVVDLLDRQFVNHSTIAIQELMHTIGALNPGRPGTKVAVEQIGAIIKAMPQYRIFVPDADTLAKAALLSGLLCRLQGYQNDARFRALHDCVLFLQARKLGLCVLTANVADFDLLLQLIPAGRVLFYKQSRHSSEDR